MESFSNIVGEIVRLLDGAGNNSDWIPLGLTFAAVLCAILGAFAAMRPVPNVARGISGTADMLERKRAVLSLRNDQSDATFDQVLVKIEKFIVQTNEQERTQLRARMMRAGFYGDRACRLYFIIRIFLAVSFPVVFMLIAPVYFPETTALKLMLGAGGLAIAGLYLPWRFIESRVESRQLALTEGFPEFLDLLVVCVEAGLTLDAGLIRVTEELITQHPIMAEQIGLVTLELKMGKTRAEALRNLATRTGVKDIKYVVTLLIQSEALGADLGETLRTQADEMRVLRMVRAEEKANKLAVKLSVCLVTFILPAMFAVVLGPAMITIARDIIPHLGN